MSIKFPVPTHIRIKIAETLHAMDQNPGRYDASLRAALENVENGPYANKGLCGCMGPRQCCPCLMRSLMPYTNQGIKTRVAAWAYKVTLGKFLVAGEDANVRTVGEITAMATALRGSRYDSSRETADRIAAVLEGIIVPQIMHGI